MPLVHGVPEPLRRWRRSKTSLIDDDTELAVVQSDSELANLFIAEALDHLGTIEAKLLELDERPEDTNLLNDIFRPFHTVKGNASALGIVSVERVAHKVENLLDLARSGRVQVGETEVDLVLRAVDVLSLMINDVGQRLAGQPRKATGAEAVQPGAAGRAPDRGAARGRRRGRGLRRPSTTRPSRPPPRQTNRRSNRIGAARRPRGAATTCRCWAAPRPPSRSTRGSSTTSWTSSAS